MHKVTLSPFFIAKYEVSQAEWRKVMGTEPSFFNGATLPVEQVSWEDCQEFCEKSGLSLPTEAQWEYACRAGSETAYHSGDSMGGLNTVAWRAWYSIAYGRGRGGGRTHPVGEKIANGFGLHDMHGNVWEWCRDWFQEDFYDETAGARDPLCKNSDSEYRVSRGGSWFGTDAGVWRSACRMRRPPWYRSNDCGFRPAWSSP